MPAAKSSRLSPRVGSTPLRQVVVLRRSEFLAATANNKEPK